ncbi:hypothetical protein B0O99DRAFT_62173 [Bisporella sp. PMI_857]|nr:hypothetical protein B0O99DRAFT_62173 [Bisporella sp. PMI_857]
MAGTGYSSYAVGYEETGQAMNGNGYGHGVGLEGRDAEYRQSGGNSASFHGGGYGGYQPPTHQHNPYGPSWARGYPPQDAGAPSGYGGPPEWQPGQQKRGYYGGGGGGGGGVGGGGGGDGNVQGGPAVETGQVWEGRRRVEISDQEDLPPATNVQQIPRPFGLSKKNMYNGSRQDSQQNSWPGNNIKRYGMGPGGSRTETFSQEETDNV